MLLRRLPQRGFGTSPFLGTASLGGLHRPRCFVHFIGEAAVCLFTCLLNLPGYRRIMFFVIAVPILAGSFPSVFTCRWALCISLAYFMDS